MKLRTATTCILFAWLWTCIAGCSWMDGSESEFTSEMRNNTDSETAMQIIQADRALQANRPGIALTYADSALRRMPDHPDALMVRGLALNDLFRYQEADTAFTQVINSDPHYRHAWHSRANTEFSMGNFRRAANDYLKAYDLAPGNNIMLNLGRAYQQLGKPDSAEWAFKKSLADSAYAITYMRLGQLYEDQGEYEKALEASRKGYELSPDNMKFRYAVGYQYLMTDQPEKAVEYFRPVVDSLPWHHRVRYNLGRALTRLGKQKEAERYMATADSLQDLHAETERLEQLAKNFPKDPSRWVKLGNAERRLGRYDEAITAYKRALFLEPRSIALHNNLAILQMENDQHDQAIKRLRSLLRANQELPEVWFNLGVVLVNSGDTASARKAWQRTLKLNPDHKQAKEYLASIEGAGEPDIDGAVLSRQE